MASITQLQNIPLTNTILLVGPPGSGKSTFCQQAVLRTLSRRPVIYVTTETPPSKVKVSLVEKGLGGSLPHTLCFVDAYHETVGLQSPDRPDTLNASSEDLNSLGIAITKLQAEIDEQLLLVFDSLTSPYLMNRDEILRFIRTTLLRLATQGNAVLVCIDEGCGSQEDITSMMSTASGIMKIEIRESMRVFRVIKHPVLKPTNIEIRAEPVAPGLESRVFDPIQLGEFLHAGIRGDRAYLRKKIGDYVNLFWPNLAHWSGVLWDPERFPVMTYEANKDDWPAAFKQSREDKAIKRALLPRRWWLLLKLFMPKDLSRVKDMRKLGRMYSQIEQMGVGTVEYLEGISETDEHYFRINECSDCWGFEQIGTTMASFPPPMLAGFCKGLEYWKGLDRDWNAIETRCIGLGDPYCEVKVVPDEIPELRKNLQKDTRTIEKIHDRLMHSLTGYLRDEKPLIQNRERLGSDIYLHPTWHAMGGEGIPAMGMEWSERYRMALRMGGAKVGKEAGEVIMDAGIGEEDAVNRAFGLLAHCKVGEITSDGTIRMRGSCESLWTKMYKKEFYRWEEPCCFFTTGFLNGYFSVVKNQHLRETKCIAMGDPYCEWEYS